MRRMDGCIDGWMHVIDEAVAWMDCMDGMQGLNAFMGWIDGLSACMQGLSAWMRWDAGMGRLGGMDGCGGVERMGEWM